MSPAPSTGHPQAAAADDLDASRAPVPLADGAIDRSIGAPPQAMGDGTDLPLTAQAWRAVVTNLRGRMSAHTHDRYVASAHLVGARETAVTIGYRSQFLVDIVRETYRDVFAQELAEVAGQTIAVDLTVLSSDELARLEPDAAGVTVEFQPLTPTKGRESFRVEGPRAAARSARIEPLGPGEPPAPRRAANGLDLRHTFESFVVGASNQFAYAACKAVADAPGRTYNPLFLWGGVGLGKTHLMQAVGNQALRENPKLSVLYTTSEQFTNDLIGAIQNHRMQAFRERYRGCDILLIDDVQFLARKTATEEEFFHTFNALHSQGKQIIVTSDTVPARIDNMEERLRSRFQWGLIADVQPPDMETRVAILKSKAEQMQLPLTDEVAVFLATHIRQNVRELEGSLVRIAAFAKLMRGPVSVDVCKDVLRSILLNKGEKVDCEQIIKTCAEYFKVTVADIKGHVRKKHLARARQAAMYLSRKLTGASYPELGDKFGGKDHSTVIHACERVPQIMAEDNDFRRAVEHLERELSAGM